MIKLYLIFILLPTILAQTTCPAVRKCIAQLDAGGICPLLPVPAVSFPEPLPAEGYRITKHRPHVFSVSDDLYSCMVIYNGGRLIMIDFPKTGSFFTSDNEYKLLLALERILNGRKVNKFFMIYTHRHIDHIGSAALVKNYVETKFPDLAFTTVLGTMEAKKALQAAGERNAIPLPTKIIKRSGARLNAFSVKLVLRVTAGHSSDDVVIHVEPSSEGMGVLHMVDYITPGRVPFIDFGVVTDLRGYVESQEDALQLNFEDMNTGHGLSTKQFLATSRQYVQSVFDAAGTSFAEVDGAVLAENARKVADPTAREFGNTQWLQNEFFQLSAEVCVRKLIEEWACSLAGVDVFGRSHCKEVVIHLNVDNQ